MTELERKCLKQNATELRRVAKVMSNLRADHGNKWSDTRDGAKSIVLESQERLEEIVRSMKSLQDVLAIPLKDYDGENLHNVKLINK